MGRCVVSGDEFDADGSDDPTGADASSAPDADEPAESLIRPLSGVDLARAALSRARDEARSRGNAVPVKRRRVGRAAAGRGTRDPGDPELLGETLSRLMLERGWDVPAAVAGVTQRWAEIAGADLADHCRPEKFDDGVLQLIAESTSWATQIRLLVPQLHQRIDDVVGRGVVTRIEVRGPTGPDWRRGALRVRGPGPRDTYG
jgi:predicted nucleic acid-binding Zn ribbon protein